MSMPEEVGAPLELEENGKTGGRCRICGAEVPAEEVGAGPGGETTCRRCRYRATLDEASRTVDEKEAAALRAASVDRTTSEKWRRRAGWIGLGLVAAGLCFVWFQVAAGPMEKPRPYALGPLGEDAPGLDEAIRGLWEVRAALDEYRYRHGGKLPATLGELRGAPATCPGCGGKWIYEKGADGSYRIACPKPEAHRRAAIFLSQRYGPPRVRLSGSGGEE